MMKKESLQGMIEGLRLHVGVSLRAIEAIPADKIDSHPIANMRSPKELALHSFAYMRCVPSGIIKGSFTTEDCAEPVDSITTRDELVKWCKESWEIAEKGLSQATDAQLGAMVETPFGKPFPGWMLATIVYDEHLHHRGQLFVYLRAMGIEPPFIWSFEDSATEFQPKAATI